MIGVTVFAAMAVLLIAYALSLYRGLNRTRRSLARAWSNLEFSWARRDGDISRLLELCEHSAPAEPDTLERLVAARAALQTARSERDVAAVSAAEGALRSALSPVYAIAARNPHSYAESLLRALRFRIRAHERAICAHCERYNQAADALNARIDLLPDALIAGLCHCAPVSALDLGVPGADIELNLAFSK